MREQPARGGVEVVAVQVGDEHGVEAVDERLGGLGQLDQRRGPRVRRAGDGVAGALRVELGVDEEPQAGDADQQRGVADEASACMRDLHGTATTSAHGAHTRGGTLGGVRGSLICVIEDEEVIAGAVAARLRAEGFSVEVAHDGAEGVALCDRLRPDLVVLDLMLPGLGRARGVPAASSATARCRC